MHISDGFIDITCFPLCPGFGDHDSELKALRDFSLKARERAYCPHSHFRVGAVLLATSGHLITGANVENVAFPTGTCAERVALGTAITSAQATKFKAVGVATDKTDLDDGTMKGFCSPCGNCRQALREFCDLDTPIYMFDSRGKHVAKTLGELLPMSFGPDSLDPPRS